MLEKFLIVGFDPGNTVGVSIINFEGKVLDVFSSRNISLSEVIVRILDFGFPIIVSTDKKNVPKNVRFLSSKLKLKVVNPKFDLKYDFKKKLVNNFLKYNKNTNEEFSVSFSNSHEFDSFSAAVFAFNKFKSLFFKIKKNIVDIKEEDFFSFVLEVFSGKNVVSVKKSFLELYSFEEKNNNVVDNKNKNSFDSVKVDVNTTKNKFFSEDYDVLKEKFDLLLKENFFLKRRVYFNNKKLFYFKSIISVLSEDVKNSLRKENNFFNKLFLLESKIKKVDFDKKFLFDNINSFDGFVFDNIVFLKQEDFSFESIKDDVEDKVVIDSFGFELFSLKEKSKSKKENFDSFSVNDFEEFIKDYKLIRKKYYKENWKVNFYCIFLELCS